MSSRWNIWILIGVLSLAVAGCGGGDANTSDSAGSGETTTVTMAHVPTTLFAPLYIAIDKGYFADEGIKVKLERVQAGQDAIALTSAGRLDAVAAGFSSAMFSAVDRGLKFKVVGSMGAVPEKGNPSAFVISSKLLKSGEVKDISDLKGHKVAVAGGEGAAGSYFVDQALRESGLSMNDVEVVPLELADQVNALDNGSVAAANLAEPFTSTVVDEGMAKVFATAPPATVATGTIYGQQFAKSEAAQPFFNALVRGSRDMQGEGKKSEENLKILAKYTGQDISVLEKIPSFSWDPNLSPEDTSVAQMETTLNSMQDAFQNMGVLEYEKDIPTKEYVDPSFSRKAASEIN